MNVRPYRSEDWPHLCAIHDAAREQELRTAGLLAAFLPLPIAAEREALFDYTLRVAELDGRVAGFVAYDAQELAWLYIAPDAQRLGVGMALAAAVKQDRPGGLSLELLDGNAAAQAFYQRCGFVVTGSHGGRMPGNERFAVRVQAMHWPGPDAAQRRA
ncbi:histone acetyltransferase [Xanthomonas axonopodis]|uniref:Histone acetyltransferase n=1 Tax=Xanthomonas axonopodis TaxID=53413 RepID=A0A0P6VBW3_9XANT|nr:GNAT family N-acetyltransferase [Xanthomonas axonopodis]KPL49772.1 histone acetyltransferase [Xanthomonas axonopodis]